MELIPSSGYTSTERTPWSAAPKLCTRCIALPSHIALMCFPVAASALSLCR